MLTGPICLLGGLNEITYAKCSPLSNGIYYYYFLPFSQDYDIMVWDLWCLSQIHMLNFQPSISQSITVFRDGAFKEGIMVKRSLMSGP